MPEKTNLKLETEDARSAVREQDGEDEVYGVLGALLGTIEIVATDDVEPIAERHARRLEEALTLCHTLEQQIELLLTLGGEDLGERLRRGRCAVRPLLEHAVQGARRCFEAHGVELRMPASGSWSEQALWLDNSRVDRMLRVLTEALVRSTGRGGSVALSVRRVGRQIELVLRGSKRAQAVQEDPALASALLERGARRLFELHGGSCSLDPEQPAVCIRLPVAEAP